MLRAEKICKVYKDSKKELEVLKGIDLDIKRNEIVSIMGPSGAGKSTLLHILGGIDNPTSGSIFLDNIDIYTMDEKKRADVRNNKIGFVFQFYHLLPEFNAFENVMFPAVIKAARIDKQAKDRAFMLLEDMGLKKRAYHKPNELSGGEQQRVAIARALINNPRILLCDEPTGNLDSKMGEEILNILFGLNKKNNTAILIVTHDKEIGKKAHRLIEMRDGRIV
jgi:lipoprotein releasing system ATP-binding protein